MEKVVCDTSHQIDSVEFCPLVEDGDKPLIAVSSSSLEGDNWGGGLSLLDATNGELLCSTVFDCGIGDIAWCGEQWDAIACAGDDNTVYLVKAAMDVDFSFDRMDVAAQRGHDDIVTSVSTNPFERNIVASGSWDMTIKLWDIQSMTSPVEEYNGHVDFVNAVAWSPLGSNFLASASQDKTVQIWKNKQSSAFLGISQDYAVLSVDWHPKVDNILALGLENGAVLVYDIRSTVQPLHKIMEHNGCVHNLKYSNIHSDLLATASDDSTVCLISGTSTEKNEIRHIYREHRDYVRGLGWGGQDIAFFATASWDKSLHIRTPEV